MHRPTEHWLLGYQEHLQRQGYQRKTIQRALAACRSFLAFLHRHHVSLSQVTPAIVEDYLTAQLRRRLCLI